MSLTERAGPDRRWRYRRSPPPGMVRRDHICGGQQAHVELGSIVAFGGPSSSKTRSTLMLPTDTTTGTCPSDPYPPTPNTFGVDASQRRRTSVGVTPTDVTLVHDRRSRLEVIGDHRPHHREEHLTAHPYEMLEARLVGPRHVLAEVRPPEVQQRLVRSPGHRLHRDLEVIDLGEVDAEPAGEPGARHRLADSAGSAEQELDPLRLRAGHRLIVRNGIGSRPFAVGDGGAARIVHAARRLLRRDATLESACSGGHLWRRGRDSGSSVHPRPTRRCLGRRESGHRRRKDEGATDEQDRGAA